MMTPDLPEHEIIQTIQLIIENCTKSVQNIFRDNASKPPNIIHFRHEIYRYPYERLFIY